MLPVKSSHFIVALLSFVLVNFFACSPDRNAQNWVRKTERQWVKLEKKQPAWLETLDAHSLNNQLQFLSMSQEQAVAWVGKPLNPAIKKNIENLDRRLKRAQTRLKLQQNDPSIYNLGLRLYTLYGHDQKLETAKVEMLEKYLDQAPQYYRQARQKLASPEASRCDSAVLQHIASVTFLRGALSKQLDGSQITVEKTKVLYKKINRACFYMKDYLAWCRSVAFEARQLSKFTK
ncbi:hypothetical protein [Haliscomenobacter hydrossis]|uniref:Uncharacterized protein n=1 Tax=Haliscomenobacter hydrossis (strain ATCC 27775 / DSM 1100 / LMG 10767 / O) TaxID=760192 RepID=F4KTT0_HALH1|nr:hypothetical protein [Haliscomenobacter hydrossis]AEE48074.1 hypothetical protein Halhy_0161 [Haliscomenobacter hydrossis DSM 1100]